MQDFIIFGIAAILIFLAPLVSKITRLSLVVIEILLGALVLNSAHIGESEALKEVAHIGFLFLMFLAGIEVNAKSFFRLGRGFLKKMAVYFLVLYLSAFLIVLAFDLPIIYAIAFPVMSLGMIMILIQDYSKKQIWVDLALKIGVVGEIISISMLVLLNGYYSFGVGYELGFAMGILVVFSAFMMIVFKVSDIIFWWFPHLRNLLIPEVCEMKEDIRYSMMLFFFMIMIVSLLDIEVALGAFISGVIISNFFKAHKALHGKLNDIGFGFLIPLFFIYIGSTLDFGAIFADKSIILHSLDICVAMIAVRFIAAFVAFGYDLRGGRNITLFVLGSAMPLTFLVATATLGLNIGAIEKNDYYSFVLAAMIEAVLFMTIIKLLNAKKGRESSFESVLDSHSISSSDLSPKQSIDSHLDSHKSEIKSHESTPKSNPKSTSKSFESLQKEKL